MSLDALHGVKGVHMHVLIVGEYKDDVWPLGSADRRRHATGERREQNCTLEKHDQGEDVQPRASIEVCSRPFNST